MRDMGRAFYEIARIFAWIGAASRGPRAVGKRARNRVIMRGVGRGLRGRRTL